MLPFSALLLAGASSEDAFEGNLWRAGKREGEWENVDGPVSCSSRSHGGDDYCKTRSALVNGTRLMERLTQVARTWSEASPRRLIPWLYALDCAGFVRSRRNYLPNGFDEVSEMPWKDDEFRRQ